MQQKTAPYDAVFVSAANWAFHLEDGIVKMGASALAFKKLLDQHVYCTQNNDFDGAQIFIQPGFKGRRIMVPDTPAFEKNKMFNFIIIKNNEQNRESIPQQGNLGMEQHNVPSPTKTEPASPTPSTPQPPVPSAPPAFPVQLKGLESCFISPKRHL